MDIANKFWGYCNKLRHDGVDPSDYIEQLTYLLFLKMAEERGIHVPKGFDWASLTEKNTNELLPHLESILQVLKTEKGILGDIFSEPVSRVRNSETLKTLINEIDAINWTNYDGDVVGLAFEELIGKVANEGKKGAGQYFTPRPLIEAIVNVIKPNPLEQKNFTIGDVAIGTAGFIVVAFDWFKKNLNNSIDGATYQRIINKTYFGQELVQRPRRLALMNMFLHGINASIRLGDTIYGVQDKTAYNVILTNPPFGNKGTNQIPNRAFPVKTSDKQLNFLQHIIEKLKDKGRAAVVLPDGCLSSEPAKKIWSYYLNPTNSKKEVCNLHTILRLPEGVFAAYANGVKACVIFLQKGVPTKKMWIFDARKNTTKITTKSNALSVEHFEEFGQSYGIDPNGKSKRRESIRFKSHSFAKLKERNFDLSFIETFHQEVLPHPVILIDEMIADYEKKILALKQLKIKFPNFTDGYTKTLDTIEASPNSNSKKRQKAGKAIEKKI